MTASVSVSTGRTSPSRSDHGGSPGRMRATAGKTCHTLVANSTTSSSADDELGHRREDQRWSADDAESNALSRSSAA